MRLTTPEPRKGLTPTPTGGPAVCAVVTCHDYARFLGQCLDSLLAQTYPFSEIVVVDDASTDETPAVCARYAPQVRYLRGEWRNCSAARNAGMAATTAPIIVNVDADNVLGPDFVAALLPFFSDLDLGIAYAPYVTMDEAGNPNGGHCPVGPIDLDTWSYTNRVDTCAMVRREAFETVGGWAGGHPYEDWRTYRSIAARGWGVRYHAEPLWRYRQHAGQASASRVWPYAPAYLAQQQSYDVAVVTPFCGRLWGLPHTIATYRALDWPRERLHCLAIDGSGDDKFNATLHEALQAAGCHDWASCQVVREPPFYPVPGTQAEWANAACVFPYPPDATLIGRKMTRVYMAAVRALGPGREFVLTVEDDVECVTPNPLSRMMAAMQPDTAAVLGVLRARNGHVDEQGAPKVIAVKCLEDDPYASTVCYDPKATGLQRIGGGHFGLRLARAFTWRLHDEHGHPLLARRGSVEGDGDLTHPWADIASDRNLGYGGWKIYLDWDIVTRHHREDGSYV